MHQLNASNAHGSFLSFPLVCSRNVLYHLDLFVQ